MSLTALIPLILAAGTPQTGQVARDFIQVSLTVNPTIQIFRKTDSQAICFALNGDREKMPMNITTPFGEKLPLDKNGCIPKDYSGIVQITL